MFLIAIECDSVRNTGVLREILIIVFFVTMRSLFPILLVYTSHKKKKIRNSNEEGFYIVCNSSPDH